MKTNFFKRLLYPLNYLLMPVAGVDIGNRAIKYVEFSNKNGSLILKNFGEIPLAENVIKNGEIVNKNALVKALSEMKNKLSSDFISVSIPEEQTYMFYAQIPDVKISEMRQQVEFRLEENIPIKADEASFEYHLIKNRKADNGNVFCSVSVIPKRVISNYTEVLDMAGLTNTSFEIESRMIAKCVIPINNHKTFIIINIKDESTTISLVVDGNTRFSSTIGVGNNMIRESLMKIDSSSYDKTGRISEKILSHDAGFNNDLFDSMLNAFSVIKDEVKRFYDYLQSKSDDKKRFLSDNVDQIILCGKSAILPGLSSYISQSFEVEVTLANVWVNVLDLNEHIPGLKFQDSLAYTAPIGLIVNSLKNNKHA